MKIYYDGTNISKYATYALVEGFTTNVSFMAQAKETNYRAFYNAHSALINSRPISMQVYSDDDDIIYKDALTIASYGTNTVVKIPVIKSTGDTNLPIIKKLLTEGVKVNITAVFTIEQIKAIYNMLQQVLNSPTVIVSIFAGRISDTGVDPFPIVQFACTLYKSLPYVEVLWAGCKEVLSINHAERAGCAIITIPDAILDRVNRIGLDLEDFSKETVTSFKADGEKSKIVI